MAVWTDIDQERAIWTIPPEKKKNGKILRVPLSQHCVSFLKSLPVLDHSLFLFPAVRGGVPSDVALSKALRKHTDRATGHRMRSSFRDWCAEQTTYRDSVSELAVHHTLKDKLQATYRRSDLFDLGWGDAGVGWGASSVDLYTVRQSASNFTVKLV